MSFSSWIVSQLMVPARDRYSAPPHCGTAGTTPRVSACRWRVLPRVIDSPGGGRVLMPIRDARLPGRNWVPLTSALAPTRPEQKKQGGAAPVIANWHSSHYHRHLSHRRSTLVIKSFPPADARTIVPTRSAVTSRTLGGDTGSGRGRWGSGLVVIAVPLVQRQSVTLHCGVRTKTQPP
jgi:hypothetical protein